MTKKHYTEVAAIIASARSEHGDSDGLRDVATELASFFKRDNARFDRERFLAACGVAA